MNELADNRESQEETPKALPLELFQSLPKTDLHVHLDGSLRLSTILELAAADGIDLPARGVDELNRAIGCG
ncbi:MAG TPA: hypothetical protein VIV60_37200, partial [Polyangiaceae bacterium]